MRWSYKTVHYELTKEGLLGSAFLDESAVELSLNEYGKAGWELVSTLDTVDGLIAIFKQPLGLESSAEFIPDGLQVQRAKVPSAEETTIEDTEDHLSADPGELQAEDDFDLLDEFEIIEEEKKQEITESVPKKDIGSIRIE